MFLLMPFFMTKLHHYKFCWKGPGYMVDTSWAHYYINNTKTAAADARLIKWDVTWREMLRDGGLDGALTSMGLLWRRPSADLRVWQKRWEWKKTFGRVHFTSYTLQDLLLGGEGGVVYGLNMYLYRNRERGGRGASLREVISDVVWKVCFGSLDGQN